MERGCCINLIFQLAKSEMKMMNSLCYVSCQSQGMHFWKKKYINKKGLQRLSKNTITVDPSTQQLSHCVWIIDFSLKWPVFINCFIEIFRCLDHFEADYYKYMTVGRPVTNYFFPLSLLVIMLQWIILLRLMEGEKKKFPKMSHSLYESRFILICLRFQILTYSWKKP